MFNSPSVCQKGYILTDLGVRRKVPPITVPICLMHTLNQEQREVQNQTKTFQNVCETGNKQQHIKYHVTTMWGKRIEKQI